jgi:hypothetical protein
MISCKGEYLHPGEWGVGFAPAKTVAEGKLFQPSETTYWFCQVVETVYNLLLKMLIRHRGNGKARFIHVEVLLSE